MLYLYLKACHVIAVVCWFAGLFYIGRLFVYHREAQQKPEPERHILVTQFKVMQRRLWYGITWPAMGLTLLFGTALMVVTGAYLQPWFHAKLGFVGLLLIYHMVCGKLRKNLDQTQCSLSSLHLRIFNEVPIMLLFAIVGIVYLKSLLSLAVGFILLALLGLSLGLGIYLYRRIRQKQ